MSPVDHDHDVHTYERIDDYNDDDDVDDVDDNDNCDHIYITYVWMNFWQCTYVCSSYKFLLTEIHKTYTDMYKISGKIKEWL